MDPKVRSDLASTGTLRAGLNMANTLLITGQTPQGEPDGVAPDMAREIARRLGVGISLVPFSSPGEVADAGPSGVWDIALIGAEPARAETIDFSAAYAEIEATYLVPASSPITSIQQVDSDGVRIAVSGRSAYDLYLSRNIKHAQLVRGRGLGGAIKLFLDDKLDALAGLRPALLEEAAKLPGTRILAGRFTAVQQAIGTQKGKAAGAQFLADFVEDAKSSGFVAQRIKRHGVEGRLSVAGS